MWTASYRATLLRNNEAFILPETTLKHLMEISQKKGIEVAGDLDSRGNLIGEVFEGTTTQVVNMGDPTQHTFFRVHTHPDSKGKCMPPSGADFASAVTDQYNAKQKVWQIVIAEDGYYLYRPLRQKMKEFKSYLKTVSSLLDSITGGLEHAVADTARRSEADSYPLVKEIVDAAIEKATNIWLEDNDFYYNRITYEFCHRDGDRRKYISEIARLEEFELHFYEHGNSICYPRKCLIHGKSRTLD